MSYSVTIGGLDNTVDFIVIGGTLHCENTIGKHGSASFTIETTEDIHLAQYQQVSVYDQNGVLAFSGYMNDPEESTNGYNDPTGWNGFIRHSVSCTDQVFLASKRRIAATFTNKTCGYIVQWLLDNILDDEGVTKGQIYDGLTPSTTLYPSGSLYPGGNVGLIPQANFGYCKVSEALDALAKAASDSGVPYYWMIDQLKQLWFVPYTTVVNSTIIDGSLQDNIKVKRTNPAYRTQQIVQGGVTQTVTQVETRKGDSNTVAWPMKYDLSTTPTITVNAVAKTVGINGVDSSQDWFWNKGSPLITQKEGATKLTSSDTLSVTYVGQYPNTVISQNAAQVSAQAAIDGTSGIIDDLTNDDTLNDINSALASASSSLTLYGQEGLLVTFDTQEAGFAPGQMVSVDLPWHDIHMEQMLIESVVASDSRDFVNIWYTVTMLQGPSDTSWQNFWGKLLKTPNPANAINLSTTTSTNILQPFTCSVTDAGVLTTNVYACPLVGPSTIMSASLIMC
jgi:hypothetical protein